MATGNILNIGGGVSPSGEYVEVIADGSKTLQTLLHDLFNLVDKTKLTKSSVLCNIKTSGEIDSAPISDNFGESGLKFTYTSIAGTSAYISTWNLYSALGNCSLRTASLSTSGTTITSATSEVTTSNTKFRIYY